MFDKTLLGRLAMKIPLSALKDKHVIEMFPAFGLLSTRLLKKEPLSYTFVEVDKNVVKSLERLAQAGQDNNIGVRLLRTEPLQDDFGRFLYQSELRIAAPDPKTVDTEELSDTVCVANAPFWCTQIFLKRLCQDVSEGAGLFKAGRVPIYMSSQMEVGHRIVTKNSELAKLVDNYFTVAPLCIIEGK